MYTALTANYTSVKAVITSCTYLKSHLIHPFLIKLVGVLYMLLTKNQQVQIRTLKTPRSKIFSLISHLNTPKTLKVIKVVLWITIASTTRRKPLLASQWYQIIILLHIDERLCVKSALIKLLRRDVQFAFRTSVNRVGIVSTTEELVDNTLGCLWRSHQFYRQISRNDMLDSPATQVQTTNQQRQALAWMFYTILRVVSNLKKAFKINFWQAFQ